MRGLIEDGPVGPPARLLHEASIEAGLYLASSADMEADKEEVRDAVK